MGYGGADTSGGSRGGSGSGGAFTGGGLRTGKTWYGTKAHFNGGLQGYSTGGSNFRSPTGQVTNSNFQTPQPTRGPSMPYPGGYVPPYIAQPLPPPLPPVQPVPVSQPIPPPAPPPYSPPPPPPPAGYSWYDALRSSVPPGNDFTGFGNQMNYTNVPKNNLGAPANNSQSRNTNGVARGLGGTFGR